MDIRPIVLIALLIIFVLTVVLPLLSNIDGLQAALYSYPCNIAPPIPIEKIEAVCDTDLDYLGGVDNYGEYIQMYSPRGRHPSEPSAGYNRPIYVNEKPDNDEEYESISFVSRPGDIEEYAYGYKNATLPPWEEVEYTNDTFYFKSTDPQFGCINVFYFQRDNKTYGVFILAKPVGGNCSGYQLEKCTTKENMARLAQLYNESLLCK